MATESQSLPYHEPLILTILTQTSFLLLLNLLNTLLNATIYCGLLGQILLGIIYGILLTNTTLLPLSAQTTIVDPGYLGLILLVFEGGLTTSLPTLLPNLPISIAVAVTGIAVPIALSFLLGPIMSASGIMCFATGAAMSATSLGITFAILSTSGFAGTRLGTVLSCAAMVDDVVGLVMIQVVGNLGGSGGGVDGGVIARPVGASLGLLLVVVAGGWGIEKVCRGRFTSERYTGVKSALLAHTALLIGLIVAASYSGTSVLFAAFLAGAGSTWWDGKRGNSSSEWTAAKRILKPFFASIGISIPITQMFSQSMVWRGIVYSLLMILGKLITGLWLLRFSLPFPFPTPTTLLHKLRIRRKLGPHNPTTRTPSKPRSLYPAAILGLSMVARGEIAFLIASIAESKGVFGRSENGVYLAVVWAAVVCTVIGPLGVGMLVRRHLTRSRSKMPILCQCVCGQFHGENNVNFTQEVQTQ
ncbi:Sodium/hydrogen exchanger [Choiromyces venosus 120613-1]|uniref:Sodium/hydrogen exchanger n=1 Tax=Choiromyces venosus 120613-1 TaxID=1336337 RepID=A0A3N4K4Y9_9PEZI|nr:Sodium/hydrogen exchanger [Choiromyces venosus 120613-1]